MSQSFDATHMPARRSIALWLLAVCALIYAMVVLGGVTRLTGSGLSMVQWQPVYGILPPQSEAQWQALFEKYQRTPEYQKVNLGMDLAGFKGIFWLEYLHRVLGRLIGLAFLLPFLVFLALKKLPRAMAPKLLTMFVLGGLQGLLGWYMVKSGLVDNPAVSQYRLTAHLMFAVLIYAYILWTALNLLLPAGRDAPRPGARLLGLKRATYAVSALIALTMASGGFVAGLDAGLAYNTFPLMGGKLVPDGLLVLEPWPMNFFENVTTVQFDHRVLAVLTLAAVIALWLAARRRDLPGAIRTGLHLLLLTALVQVGLGIATLLMHVPVALGSAHQGVALALLTLALVLSHRMRALAAARSEPATARESLGQGATPNDLHA